MEKHFSLAAIKKTLYLQIYYTFLDLNLFSSLVYFHYLQNPFKGFLNYITINTKYKPIFFVPHYVLHMQAKEMEF